ncbi:MAG: mechanosensitive ion channel [Flavobacteriaceae bacterium]|nr:mechanosensitive ion channel [Flavobacteriaceae bacterium]
MVSQKKHFFISLKIAVLLAFLSPLFSFSQEETKIDSLIIDKPVTIQLANVIKQIEDADFELKKILTRAKPSANIREIDSVFPSYVEFLGIQKKYAEKFIKGNPNRQKINYLINRWENYIIHLEKWENEINNRESNYELFLDELLLKKQTWLLTYENAKNENAPNAVILEIESILNEIKNIEVLIFKKKNKLLSLEAKINKQKRKNGDVINDLLNLKKSEVYDLFFMRHEPIWESSFHVSENLGFEKNFTESIPKKIFLIFSLVKKDASQFYLFLISIVLISVLLKFLKKSFEKYPFNEEDQNLQRAKSTVLNHSRETIAFLVLFIARFYFKEAPSLLVYINIFMLLIVAIQLVRPVIYTRFKKALHIIILFFLINLVKNYVWFDSLSYRFYMIFEAVLFISLLLYFTYPYHKLKNLKKGNLGSLLIKLIPYLYLSAIISIIANVLGYTNFGELAIRVNINSAIIIVIFYAFLMSFSGVAIGIIHHNFSTQKNIDTTHKFKVEKKILNIIRVFVIVYCLITFLNLVDLWLPLTDYLSEALSTPYTVGSATFTFGVVLTFLSILLGSFFVTGLISFILNGEVLAFLKLPKGIPAAISLVIRYFIIGFGFVLALSSLGVNLGKFNLMAGALGLGIGFGLQTIISNFISGLILVFERPILPGDTVEVNNLLGVVKKIGVRSSKISTFDGAEVIVPNNNLISDDLINWTLSSNIKRVEILIGTTYASDPNKTLEILTEIANNNEKVLKNPAPIALFSDFGDSSLNFKLRIWVNYEIGLQVKSDVSIEIYNKFKELGIEIPFPQQDIYIKSIPQQFDVEKMLTQNKKDKSKHQKPIKNTEPLPEDLDTEENNL